MQHELKDVLSTESTNTSQVLLFFHIGSKIILYLHSLVLLLCSLNVTFFTNMNEVSTASMTCKSIIPFYLNSNSSDAQTLNLNISESVSNTLGKELIRQNAVYCPLQYTIHYYVIHLLSLKCNIVFKQDVII